MDDDNGDDHHSTHDDMVLVMMRLLTQHIFQKRNVYLNYFCIQQLKIEVFVCVIRCIFRHHSHHDHHEYEHQAIMWSQCRSIILYSTSLSAYMYIWRRMRMHRPTIIIVPNIHHWEEIEKLIQNSNGNDTAIMVCSSRSVRFVCSISVFLGSSPLRFWYGRRDERLLCSM